MSNNLLFYSLFLYTIYTFTCFFDRLLWHSYSNRQSMIKDGVVRAVSMVLIKNTQRWLKKDEQEPVRKRREKLLENVLKCLLLFSKWSTPECAHQVILIYHLLQKFK